MSLEERRGLGAGIEEQVADLQARITVAQRERIRAEAARDHAEAAAKQARDELVRDFGVTNAADAEKLLAQLRKELAEVTERISAQLDQIGV